jgi:hypothetical protein
MATRAFAGKFGTRRDPAGACRVLRAHAAVRESQDAAKGAQQGLPWSGRGLISRVGTPARLSVTSIVKLSLL